MNKKVLSMDELVDFARVLAYEAGRIARQAFFDNHLSVRKKEDKSYVTNLDLEIEAMLKKRIKERYPEHTIIAEEKGNIEGDKHVWYIDPIDGTNNLARHVPFFAISIGYEGDGEFGVVYNPITDEMFYGYDGKAYLNGTPLRVEGRKEIAKAHFGICYTKKSSHVKRALALLSELNMKGLGARKYGAA